jgi:hypothetical protein
MIEQITETWPEEPMAPNGHHVTVVSGAVFEWES